MAWRLRGCMMPMWTHRPAAPFSAGTRCTWRPASEGDRRVRPKRPVAPRTVLIPHRPGEQVDPTSWQRRAVPWRRQPGLSHSDGTRTVSISRAMASVSSLRTHRTRSPTFDASSEHSPMSGVDEYLIHNYPSPVRVMWTPDSRLRAVWFTCQDRTGDLLVTCGLGFYPNLGTAEAFAIVNVRGQHTTCGTPQVGR